MMDRVVYVCVAPFTMVEEEIYFKSAPLAFDHVEAARKARKGAEVIIGVLATSLVEGFPKYVPWVSVLMDSRK